MKRLLPLLAVASFAANVAHGALAQLNVAEGSIETPDGSFVGRDFTIAKDFKMELLYIPPNNEGKWVAHTWDDKNRLIVSSYNSDVMVRLTIPPVGSPGEVRAELINGTRVGAAEGLANAWGGLYMNVNRSGTMRHGIYRLEDTNGDDKYDKTSVVRIINTGGGDHGTHDLDLAPDGKSIYVMSGNSTWLVEHQTSRVPLIWGEDNLVIRNQVGGQGVNNRAPGAFIVSFDRAANFELFSMGMRNPVSQEFNKDGELFVYDSDLEWDMGLPWYRPTVLVHAVSGADTGWRDGSRKHPGYYFDYFGVIADVGSGSPVGSASGTGSKFPARYQDAVFIADWSYGNLWAALLTPDGASYKSQITPFINGRPFQVSGVTVNKQDGSLIVMTTGTQLYRITYTGTESTAPTRPDTTFAAARATRRSLEAFHGKKDPAALAVLWPHLNNQDRAIRYAARTALEWQDVGTWRDRALAEPDARRAIAAIASLARVSGKDIYNQTANDPPYDKVLQGKMVAALDKINWNNLAYQDKLDLLRAYSLTFIRLGEPDGATRQRLIAKFDPSLPAEYREMNWELSEMLIYLQAPSAATKVMALLRNAPGKPINGIHEYPNPQLRQRTDRGGGAGPNIGVSQVDMAKQEDQIKYAELLRTLTNGWTMPLREEYMKWFTTPQPFRGGNHYAQSIQIIRADAVSQLPPEAQTALATIISAPIAISGGGRGGGGGGGGGGAAGGAAPGGAPAPAGP